VHAAGGGGAAKEHEMPYIEIDNARKSYPQKQGANLVLANINLNMERGQFISILGPSGCGKSTLLKCIAGLETLSEGAIRFDGIAVDSPPIGLGMVFQRDVLLDWRNIIDNVMISAEFQGKATPHLRERGLSQLERFGLSGYAKRHPWELSGGQRQRVSICRALITDPHVLLMDEPFGALDAMTRDDLNQELARLSEETRKTTIFVTHSITEAVFLSDRILVMDRNPGRIIEDLFIELPRPRTLAVRSTGEFAGYNGHIRQLFADLGIIKDH
jgi:NitT/TauT family transport system ATP-binding protein